MVRISERPAGCSSEEHPTGSARASRLDDKQCSEYPQGRDQHEACDAAVTDNTSATRCYTAPMAQAEPAVRTEKLPLPTLWLNSTVEIKLAKIDRVEGLQPGEIERDLRLRDLISKLVDEGR